VKKLILGLAIALAACGGKKDDKKVEGGSAVATGSGSSMTGNGSSMASGSGSATASGSGSATAAGSGSATANAGSGSAAGSDVAVPTETDFEADAKSKITDKNVTGELDKLEKDLGNN
jgi:iron uptake system component EfeO